jgi:hypothetical protein
VHLTPDQNLISFTKPGLYSWTPPHGVLAIDLMWVDSGAGGGSGRLQTTANTAGGGSGGASGAAGRHVIYMGKRTDLFDKWEISVAEGGAGGAPISGVAANGNAGSNGAFTTVTIPGPLAASGTTIFQNGSVGTGGGGGTATTSTGGTASGGMIVGINGGSAQAGAPSAGANVITPSAIGGGAGGFISNVPAAFNGQDGGVWTGAVGHALMTTRAAGGLGVLGVGVDGEDGLLGYFFVGTGGAGGGAGQSLGGRGGNGILGGGGGGGGGAAQNGGSVSGAGGKGGDGAVFILLIWG